MPQPPPEPDPEPGEPPVAGPVPGPELALACFAACEAGDDGMTAVAAGRLTGWPAVVVPAFDAAGSTPAAIDSQ
jgi:hypothetical protein